MIITYRYFNIRRWDKHHLTQNEMVILIMYTFLYKQLKKCHKAAENAKINAILNTRKQLLVSDENIGIQDQP